MQASDSGSGTSRVEVTADRAHTADDWALIGGNVVEPSPLAQNAHRLLALLAARDASGPAEIVFTRPGIGKLVYDGVISRNYPVVMGAVLVTTILFVLSTLLADLINAKLDPRVRDKL